MSFFRYHGAAPGEIGRAHGAGDFRKNIAQLVVVTDADAWRLVMMNPAAAAVTGSARVREALGQRPSLWRSNRHDAAFYE
ncbi:MAG: hypothetical protein IPO19_22915 [Rhodoferax sp.]|nr:hypothetical protein [Rhodoferax sp.]